jgi:hypothetical protein
MRRLASALVVLTVLGGCGASQSRLAQHRFAAIGGARGGSGQIIGANPVNEALPVVSGTAEEGQELKTTIGTWKHATSYTYQWEKCNTSGAECVPIPVVSEAHIVAEGYAGHTLRAVVTAHNAGAAASVASAATETIKGGASVPTNCFKKISNDESCGVTPDESEAGVEAGHTLETVEKEPLILSTKGQHYENKKVIGELLIEASEVTVKNVEVIYHEVCGVGKGIGGVAIKKKVEEPINVTIEHVTVHPPEQNCPSQLGEAFDNANGGESAHFLYDKAYWVAHCFQYATFVEHSYCDTNGNVPGAHNDGFYSTGGKDTFKYNTIFQPHQQTSPLFLPDTGVWEESHIEYNFLAGGGYLIYPPGGPKSTGTITGEVYIRHNRAARCGNYEHRSHLSNGAYVCEGLSATVENTEAPTNYVPDEHGFFPHGGAFGENYEYSSSKVHVEENYWDDNLETALLTP